MDFSMVRQASSTIIVVLFIARGSLLAQTPASTAGSPAYEVASIRQNMNPNPRWSMSFTPDGVRARDVTLIWALHEAYGVYDSELWSGGPQWLDNARFDIEAKYDVSKYPKFSREERQAMLRQLLADRFKVVVHHESKEFPLYALEEAKDGPRFKETKPEDLQKSTVNGVMCVTTGGHRGTIEMHGCTTTQLANSLSGYGQLDLGRKVVDKTGLSGYFSFALHWTPVNAADSFDAVMSASEASGPSLFTAVKEQLGLELKPIRGPLDTIVIDHAEMPSEN